MVVVPTPTDPAGIRRCARDFKTWSVAKKHTTVERGGSRDPCVRRPGAGRGQLPARSKIFRAICFLPFDFSIFVDIKIIAFSFLKRFWFPPPSHRDATTPSPCWAPHFMTQGRIMFSNPTPGEPRLSPAATMSDATPSALTPSLYCVSFLQPAAPPQVVAFES